MPLLPDSTSHAAITGAPASSLTWSHACGGAERWLWVAFALASGVGVSTVTFNGVAASLTQNTSIANGAGTRVLFIWESTSQPDPGTHDILISLAAPDTFSAVAVSWSGINQTFTYSGGAQANAVSDTNPTVTVVSSALRTVLNFMTYQDGVINSLGAGQTELVRDENVNPNNFLIASYEPGAPSVIMDYTLVAAKSSASFGLSLNPSFTAIADSSARWRTA